MKLTVLYPFIEEAFCEQTESFIAELSWMKQSQAIDLLIIVNKEGKTSDCLKKAGLSYQTVAFEHPVHARDFYFIALFKLVRSSLPSFFYFNSHQIDVVHCPDLLSLLCWGNVAKMNRIPFVASVQKKEKIAHYASLMLADSRKIICNDEEIRSGLPKRFFSSSLVAPPFEKSNTPALRKEIVDFWIKLYVSLFLKPDLNKMNGILNKD